MKGEPIGVVPTELKILLGIQSVSTLPERKPDMQKAREYLMDVFSVMGFKTQILEGQKHDAVYAERIENPSLPTVLVYGHYDVQPGDPEAEWKSPPFVGTIRDGKLYARGAADNKGQHFVHITAVKRMLEEGERLPVNMKFLIEGEEEIGSPSVQDMAKKYSRDVLRCDYLIVSDGEAYAEDQPSIDTSLRGLLYVELKLQTAEHDLHSGIYGGVAINPANELSRIISSLKDKDGKIAIPGFYDRVEPVSSKALADAEALRTTAPKLMEEGHFYAISTEGAEHSLNQRRWYDPTLDVNGITSGFQGEGPKTIIPKEARAKISMRLVPRQDPGEIYALLESYLPTIVPNGVKFELKQHATALPYMAPTDHPVFSLMEQSLQKAFGVKPVYTGVGGTIGFIPVLSQEQGNVPCLMVGFALPDCNMHAPNENLDLKTFTQGVEAMVDFYKNLPRIHTN